MLGTGDLVYEHSPERNGSLHINTLASLNAYALARLI